MHSPAAAKLFDRSARLGRPTGIRVIPPLTRNAAVNGLSIDSEHSLASQTAMGRGLARVAAHCSMHLPAAAKLSVHAARLGRPTGIRVIPPLTRNAAVNGLSIDSGHSLASQTAMKRGLARFAAHCSMLSLAAAKLSVHAARLGRPTGNRQIRR